MYFLFFLLSLAPLSNSSEIELKTHLLQNYRNDVKPSRNSSIQLKLGLALRALNNIDQIDGTLDMNVWLRYWWKDDLLTWEPSEHDNIEKVNFFTNDYDHLIWTPDIYLYNTAENPLEQLDHSMAMVYSDGNVIWSRPGMIKSTCEFQLDDFPYDVQTCSLKFGSWSYHKGELNLSIPEFDTLDISNFQPNQGWDLKDWTARIEEKKYNCCPEIYQNLIIDLILKRDPSYYVLNIIIPTFATASLMIISLLIPWDSGERISFAVTVMLSIIVFLLILSENLPKTKTKPLLSRMLVGLVFFSLFVVFFTIVISYMHSKKVQMCIPRRKSKKELEEEEAREQEEHIGDAIEETDISELEQKANQLRTISYRESIDSERLRRRNNNESNVQSIVSPQQDTNQKKEDNSELKEDCEKLADKIENIFTVIFFVGFVIYTVCIFKLS